MHVPAALPCVRATWYVTALREGGSLPGLVEASDDGMYVVKFRGSGQCENALVAEVVAGELARRLGLLVPDLAVIQIPVEMGRAEPDPDIQELLDASAGPNLGMDFLPGALPFTLPLEATVDPEFAADVVWFDTLVTNVDRTHRNPNLLIWHGRTWLIDHGAAFFRLHGERPLAETAHDPVPVLADHVLLRSAGPIAEADERLVARALAAIDASVSLVPAVWLGPEPEARRQDIADFLRARLESPRAFVAEAERARA
jgi:hypothetical protein